MERLLSEQEMKDHLPTGFDPEPCDLAMCVAQLAKADKEWVEWAENLQVGEDCHTIKCNYRLDCLNGIFTTACIKWENRRKEIGL
jgi:hypothetical protein